MKIILDVFNGVRSGIQNNYDLAIFSEEGTDSYFLHGGTHIFEYRYLLEHEDDFDMLGENISGDIYDIFSFIDTRIQMWNANKVYLDDHVIFAIFCKSDPDLTTYRFIDTIIKEYEQTDLELTLFISEMHCYSIYKHIKDKQIDVYFICDINVL